MGAIFAFIIVSGKYHDLISERFIWRNKLCGDGGFALVSIVTRGSEFLTRGVYECTYSRRIYSYLMTLTLMFSKFHKYMLDCWICWFVEIIWIEYFRHEIHPYRLDLVIIWKCLLQKKSEIYWRMWEVKTTFSLFLMILTLPEKINVRWFFEKW